MEFLDKLIHYVNSVPEWIYVGGAFVLETIQRLWPTAKPKSWLRIIADLFAKVSQLFSAAAGVVDKLVPDRVKEEKPPELPPSN